MLENLYLQNISKQLEKITKEYKQNNADLRLCLTILISSIIGLLIVLFLNI